MLAMVTDNHKCTQMVELPLNTHLVYQQEGHEHSRQLCFENGEAIPVVSWWVLFIFKQVMLQEASSHALSHAKHGPTSAYPLPFSI